MKINIQEESQVYLFANYCTIIQILNKISQKIQRLIHHVAVYLHLSSQIIINKIPDSIQKYPTTLKKCIELLKSPIKRQQTNKMCWIINLDRRVLQLEFLDYKKYSSFTFLDPSRNLFGFTYADSQFRSRQASIQRSIKLGSRQKPNHSKERIKNITNIDLVSRKSSNESYQNQNSSRFSTDSQQKISQKYIKSPNNHNYTKILESFVQPQNIKQSNINSKTINSISEYSKNIPNHNDQIKINTISYDQDKKKEPSPATKFEIFASRNHQRFEYYKNAKNINKDKKISNDLSLNPRQYIESQKQFQKLKIGYIKTNEIKSSNLIDKSMTQRIPQKDDITIKNNDSFYKRVKDILKK